MKDKNIIATCLQSTSGMLYTGQNSVMVAERNTGKIQQFSNQIFQKTVATFNVDPKNYGGLLDFALDPNYLTNSIIYGLVTNGDKIQLVKTFNGSHQEVVYGDLAPAFDNPVGKIFFVGQQLIMAFSSGNFGIHDGPAKILLINMSSNGSLPDLASAEAIFNQSASSVSICPTPDYKTVFIPVHTSTSDEIYKYTSNSKNMSLFYKFDNNSRFLSDCAVSNNSIYVTEKNSDQIEELAYDKNYKFAGSPTPLLKNKYGRMYRILNVAKNTLLVDTNNHDAGNPIPSDDRAILIKISGSGGSRAGQV